MFAAWGNIQPSLKHIVELRRMGLLPSGIETSVNLIVSVIDKYRPILEKSNLCNVHQLCRSG
jgi:hypothetical protein